jgi:uncharacterized SAM-binding protein YcdF (DUF218 family)
VTPSRPPHDVRAAAHGLASRGATLAAAAVVRPLLPLLARRPAFRALAARQFAAEPPAPADLIHVLGGAHRGPAVRIDHGVALYRLGLAPRLLLTGSEWGIDWAARNRARALALGVPAAALLGDPAPRSTREEAAVLGRVAAGGGLRCVILVTEAFHSGRAERLFARALEGSGVRLLSCPAAAAGFPPTRWWEEPGLRARVIGEAARLAVARVTGAL